MKALTKEELVMNWHSWLMKRVKLMGLSSGQRSSINSYALLTLKGLTIDLEKHDIDTKHKCWFCGDIGDDLVFEVEFDTYVHIDCIRTALNEDPTHPEANLMKHLFKPL